MSLKLHAFVFVVLVSGGIAAASKCPSKEDIQPCTCRDLNDDAIVTCVDLQNLQELIEAFGGLKGHRIYSLEVKDSYLGDVPGYLFKDTNIEVLKFSYTKLTSIGDDKDPPFAGLENTLKSLTIVEGFWDYDKPLTKPIRLGHLKKLTFLNLENNVISKLGNEWFENGPHTLRDLYITTGLVKELGDKAFSTLNNLRSLHFTGNDVTPQRTALPANAIYMDSLDLSENKIKELPSDLFTNLPALKYLYLLDNGLTAIPEDVWKSTLLKLDFLFISSNPLVCDSKMKWIFNGNLHEKIIGECALPKSLAGREIDTLTAEEIAG